MAMYGIRGTRAHVHTHTLWRNENDFKNQADAARGTPGLKTKKQLWNKTYVYHYVIIAI